MTQRNSNAHWMCTPHPTHWWIQALQMVHGIGVRCEVELPKQEYAMAMLPDIIEQMTDALAEEKEKVLQHIARNHEDALETETAIEKSTETPTRH